MRTESGARRMSVHFISICTLTHRQKFLVYADDRQFIFSNVFLVRRKLSADVTEREFRQIPTHDVMVHVTVCRHDVPRQTIDGHFPDGAEVTVHVVDLLELWMVGLQSSVASKLLLVYRLELGAFQCSHYSLEFPAINERRECVFRSVVNRCRFQGNAVRHLANEVDMKEFPGDYIVVSGL